MASNNNSSPRTFILTVGEAKKLYRDHGERLYPGTDNLLRFVRTNHCSEALSNDNYVDALAFADLMFRNTNTSMRMLTGSGGDGFIDVLQDTFCAMLNRFKVFKGFAKIIIAGPKKPDKLAEIEQEYKDNLTVIAAQPLYPEIQHYTACDSCMLREEEPHKELVDDDPADIITAKVYFHNPRRSKVIEQRFDETWEYLRGL